MDKSVTIIGGGISGLVCAGRLRQLGFTNVTVYDTGIYIYNWLFPSILYTSIEVSLFVRIRQWVTWDIIFLSLISFASNVFF